MDAEVGVIGLGTMGSMTLWQLTRKGISAIGFEQFGIGHDYSAAGGETRLFRTAYSEGKEYVPILRDAYKYWRKLEEETGTTLLNMIGGLMIGDPDSKFIKEVLKSIEDHHLEHEILDEYEAEKRYPQHKLLPGEVIVNDKNGGYLRPELAVVTAVNRARELGAKAYSFSPVDQVESIDDGVKVISNGQAYRFKKVIITAGPWINSFLPNGNKQVSIKRIVMGWFAAEDINDFHEEKFPIFIRESNEDKFYGAPTVEGSMVKVAMFSNYGFIANPDKLNRTVDVDDLIPLRKTVEKYIPSLYCEPVRISAYMDAFTENNHPIIDTSSEDENIIILGGFSGHGFKMAPTIGKIAAELAQDGSTKYPVNHFSKIIEEKSDMKP